MKLQLELLEERNTPAVTGYEVVAFNNAVGKVWGSWVVPSTNVAAWVGIDNSTDLRVGTVGQEVVVGGVTVNRPVRAKDVVSVSATIKILAPYPFRQQVTFRVTDATQRWTEVRLSKVFDDTQPMSSTQWYSDGKIQLSDCGGVIGGIQGGINYNRGETVKVVNKDASPIVTFNGMSTFVTAIPQPKPTPLKVGAVNPVWPKKIPLPAISPTLLKLFAEEPTEGPFYGDHKNKIVWFVPPKDAPMVYWWVLPGYDEDIFRPNTVRFRMYRPDTKEQWDYVDLKSRWNWVVLRTNAGQPSYFQCETRFNVFYLGMAGAQNVAIGGFGKNILIDESANGLVLGRGTDYNYLKSPYLMACWPAYNRTKAIFVAATTTHIYGWQKGDVIYGKPGKVSKSLDWSGY